MPRQPLLPVHVDSQVLFLQWLRASNSRQKQSLPCWPLKLAELTPGKGSDLSQPQACACQAVI